MRSATKPGNMGQKTHTLEEDTRVGVSLAGLESVSPVPGGGQRLLSYHTTVVTKRHNCEASFRTHSLFAVAQLRECEILYFSC